MGLGIEEEPVWRPPPMQYSMTKQNRFYRGKKRQTQETILRMMVGRSGEPKWARDGRCRRRAGRMGAGELGLERSSVAVPSRKAEKPVVVWVRSVGGGAKKLARVVASPT